MEVQCATVTDVLSGKIDKSPVKHKQNIDIADDSGDDDSRPSVKRSRPNESRRSRKSGRPNLGKEANDRNLWEALKAGISFERSLHQSKKLKKFKEGNACCCNN